MNITTLAILSGLVAALGAEPAVAENPMLAPQPPIEAVTIASIQTPPPPDTNLELSYPERPFEEPWNDTSDVDLDSDVYLETDLRNDVHAPLLEDATVEPVDILVPETFEPFVEVLEPEPRDPHQQPLP